jgi:glyoxylase-like metal-dependent hydrolase (beta-lactamase superfamily II)
MTRRQTIALAWLGTTCLALLTSAERVSAQGNQTPAWAWKPPISTVRQGEVAVFPVRGNISMLIGAGGNITVSAGGNDGILLVDSGLASMSGKVLEAVRSISSGPIRYIVNTSERDEHTGGNAAIAAAGETIPFRPAEDVRVSDGRLGNNRANVIAFLTVFHRMSAPTGQVAARPEDAWPDNTYSTPQKKLYFNDEPVLIMHNPSNTDGNSIVHFRTADVISVGDLVDLTGYPFIDPKAGGTINTVIDGLNRLIELTVPNRKSEAGTLVIPGHGRLADQPDVVYYQQMTIIIRDRIQDMISRGMTLEQIKAARPTRDYETRYGRTSGPWTTDMFIEAAYAGLATGKK